MLYQQVAEAAVAAVGADREAGQLGHAVFRERQHRDAGGDAVVVFQHRVVADLHFQVFAAALDQDALFLQRADQRQDVADVLDAGLADLDQRIARDHGAGAVVGKQLHQQRAVVVVADQVRAHHALAGGADGVGQAEAALLAADAALVDRLRLVGGDGVVQHAVGINQAVALHQEDQLLRLQLDGGMAGHFFHGHVEGFAGRRVADQRGQHQLAAVEALVDGLGVDLAHAAAVLHVDAVDHAQRLRGDEVAAGDAQVGTVHRRIGHPHRQEGFQIMAQAADRRFHRLQRRAVGHAAALVEVACNAAQAQLFVDLRPRAVHQHDAHAEADQQVQVLRQTVQVAARQALAIDGDDEGFATKGVDVRRRLAKGEHKIRVQHDGPHR
ncbi:hypothetical protein D3C72_1147960 [compost metagenome]